MAFQAGTKVDPRLMQADYSGFTNAANIRANALANLGQQIGDGIEKYQKNKEITAAGLASLEGTTAANPDLLLAFQSDTGDAGKAYKKIEGGDYNRKDVLIANGFASSYVNQQKITQANLEANRQDPTAGMQNYQYLIQQGVSPDEARERSFGKSSTNINVGGEPGVGDAIIKQTFGKDQQYFLENVQPGIDSLPNLQFMEQMLNVVGDDGEVITGKLAKPELFLKSLARDLGVGEFSDVAATQAYLATAGRQVGQVIRLFGSGTGLSDADREYAEKIAAGSIAMDKDALKRLVRMARTGIKGQVGNFNRQMERSYSPDIVDEGTSNFALARLITPTEGLFDYETSVSGIGTSGGIDSTGGSLGKPTVTDEADEIIKSLGLETYGN
tara:strand:+ start:141 stop:1298 length:1158 start_codon:yes stop_codon:yes gene_type:complete